MKAIRNIIPQNDLHGSIRPLLQLAQQERNPSADTCLATYYLANVGTARKLS